MTYILYSPTATLTYSDYDNFIETAVSHVKLNDTMFDSEELSAFMTLLHSKHINDMETKINLCNELLSSTDLYADFSS